MKVRRKRDRTRERMEEKRSSKWTYWMRIKSRRVHEIEPAKEIDSISSLSKHLCRQEFMTDTARKRVREQTC